MSVVVVNTTAGLLGALKTATAGETIELAPGTYSSVNLPNIHPSGTVTITSQYAWNQASITGLVVNTSSNLSFRSLDINATSLTPATGGGNFTWVAEVEKSSNVHFTQVNVHGLAGETAAQSVSGIEFVSSTNVSVSNSSFQYLYNGVADYGSSGFTANSSTFNHIFTDGIHGAGSSNVTISANSFTNMHEDMADLDHPDMIQFFTAGTTASASNFYIANNTYSRGDGSAVQGIFFNDEVGTLPYQNVTIINNHLAGSLWRGISVSDGNHLNISGNSIVSYLDNWSAVVVQGSANASVTNNQAFKFTYQNDTNLFTSGNTLTAQVAGPALQVQGLQDFAAASTDASLGQGWAGWDPSLGLGSFGNTIAVAEPAVWAVMFLGMALVGVVTRDRKARSGVRA